MCSDRREVRVLIPFRRSSAAVMGAMGIAQILAWGTSYYLLAALANPIAKESGWAIGTVVGGLSIGLFVAGALSPMVGRIIQKRGGRSVLAGSSFLLAAGLVAIAASEDLLTFLAAWIIMGGGMACGLYDAAFATLGRLFGSDARAKITILTLFGGFASTICWPLLALLVEAVGWRGACLVFAGVQVVICAPAYLIFVPELPIETLPAKEVAHAAVTPASGILFQTLAAILVLAAAVTSIVSVHLLTMLQMRGYNLAEAVSVGAFIGPAQVAARTVEMAFGRRQSPFWILLAAVSLIAVGMLILSAPVPYVLVIVAIVLYGAGNGLYTIARGAIPLVIFDPRAYAVNMGRLGPASLSVQALAPVVAAYFLGADGAGVVFILALAALANVAAVIFLWRRYELAPANRCT